MTGMRKLRELAMQVLFLWDANGDIDLQTGWQATDLGDVEEGLRMRALHTAEQTWTQRQTIDAWVERIAPQWPPRRQPAVDRNIIRLAVWELTNSATPPKVVIDEAIELAKEFSTEQSPAFVNGVLDAILHAKEKLTAEKPADSTTADSTTPEPTTPELTIQQPTLSEPTISDPTLQTLKADELPKSEEPAPPHDETGAA